MHINEKGPEPGYLQAYIRISRLTAVTLSLDVDTFISCISYCEFSSAASCRISYPIEFIV